MSEINLIKSCLRKYLSSGGNGNYLSSNGLTAITSGSNSPIMNFAIIDDAVSAINKTDLVANNFNVNGFLISDPDSRGLIGTIAPHASYVGEVVVARSDGYDGEPVVAEGIEVQQINEKNEGDYLHFMSEQRGTEPEIMKGIVDGTMEDLFVYLAYFGNEVVGAGTAIKNGNSVMIFDAVVKNDRMNSGIFSSIVTRSMSDVSKMGQHSYYALISSEPSLRGAVKANFKKIKFVDLWINERVVN